MKRTKTVKKLEILGVMALAAMASNPSWAANQAVAAAPTVVTSGAKNPIHYLSTRARQQMIQIQKDVKAGKLTAAQAKALQGQIQTVRQQEMADLKQNGNHQLTDTQFAQLTGQFDTISKSIPLK